MPLSVILIKILSHCSGTLKERANIIEVRWKGEKGHSRGFAAERNYGVVLHLVWTCGLTRNINTACEPCSLNAMGTV